MAWVGFYRILGYFMGHTVGQGTPGRGKNLCRGTKGIWESGWESDMCREQQGLVWVELDFSTLTLLIFGPGSPLWWEGLSSALEVFSSIPFPYFSCPFTLANVPWGDKNTMVKNTCTGRRWQMWAQRRKKALLFFCFLEPHLWHMDVSRLGVKSELQLPAYTTATATWDPSCVCDLYHSSRQCQILNSLSKARDRTRILMNPNWICYC